MRPIGLRRDPAPSRISYRLNRLMLTPGFRTFLKWGVPSFLIFGLLIGFFVDERRRNDAMASVQEIRRQIEQRPEFMVRVLSVDGASDPIADLIREAADIELPVSSFDLDLDALQSRIEALEAVQSAGVRVRAGGVLDIGVTERVPVAIWRDGDVLHLVDIEGYRVTEAQRRAAHPELPLLVGEGAERHLPEAMVLIAAAQPVHGRLRGMVRVGERRWDVVLDRDQRVLLPEIAPEDALRKVIALHLTKGLLDREISVVDMRIPERMTLRLTPAAIDAMNDTQDVTTGAY